MVCVHSATDDGGAPDAEHRNWITRLLPRGVRYTGRVHEQPVSRLPRARIALHVGHDGYLEAQRARKGDRNRPLLLRDLQERPGDAYLLYQLGKDAEQRGDLTEAGTRYECRAGSDRAPGANWRHALVVRRLHCLGKTRPVRRRFRVRRDGDGQLVGVADFFFVLGNVALDRSAREPAQALEQWLPLAITALERCLEIGERPDLEGSMQGCGSHLARHNLEAAQVRLLHAAQAELARIAA